MTTTVDYKRIAIDGFWDNNPALVQLLGMCPMLAVTSTAVNGLGLGLATTLTLVLSNGLVSLIRNIVRPEVRIPTFVLIIASVVTVIELLMNAYVHELYTILGIFVPLIVTNCSIIGRAEAFASKHALLPSLVDGLTMGLGFTAVLFTLGMLREFVGQGTVFSQFHLLFGEAVRGWSTTVLTHYEGFLVAVLPPGAFFGLGLLIALKNLVDARRARRAHRRAARAGAPAAA
ncbi:MAG: electron transport complex subunit E [Gammaproteobacteria bacterium]|nr:MAG: electron transport complex subunit E [Gammaproteobacteria bacterium]